MTYSENLKDPRWQRKRLEILQRDNFTCQLCKDSETTLHIHHKKYFNKTNPWDYENGFLTTLCHHCHSSIELLKKIGFGEDSTRAIKIRQQQNANNLFEILCNNEGAFLINF